ncbi:MAG TPA: carboxypeptidase-like regulatory domain-containing protein [Candidatus Acidoferrales bacterium]|nr:carboxypeptidase-like regulatory domain-containing protein [Candidatus Acidoferrales bacterium]
MRKWIATFLGLAALLFAGGMNRALAQTATTGAVVGGVTDPSGAVIGTAQVELRNLGTNLAQHATTDTHGQYSFPSVAPGNYALTVTMQGFRTSTIANLVVDVAKSYQVNVTLQLGAVSQTVQVEAGATVELQTTDASLGHDLESTQLMRLPTVQNNAAELLSLQPAVTPGNGGFPAVGMRVSGAIDDQNTVTLDGIDITDNLVGGGNSMSTWVPITNDSVEELRVGVTNPNATFGRSSGGQVTVVSRHGTNDFHGAVYWLHQNDEFNANTWDNNRTHVPRTELKDNRGGFNFGGPIWKNKTWFFTNYEIRRFPQSSNIVRTVPRPTLKAGILQFRDASGNVVAYNLKTTALCGTGGSQACDPRGLGISPSVQDFWNLMPNGNDPSTGDGLNTIGFRGTVSNPLHDDYITFRLDQAFTSKWRFSGSYTYFRELLASSAQLDIRGGNVKSVSNNPTRAAMVTGQLTTTISPTVLNTARFGWVRNLPSFTRLSPTASAAEMNIPGTQTADGPIAINPASDNSTGLLASPIDNNSGNARFQAYIQKNTEFGDDLDVVRGSHTMSFGMDYKHLPLTHLRADKVVGSITSLVSVMSADATPFLAIPGSDRPQTCAGGISTNCLSKSDVQEWDELYAASLGLIDNVSVLTVRDGNFNPLPFGTPLIADTTQNAWFFYGQDSWRLRPSLTFNYGLSYGWQSPPVEKLGRQTLIINNTNNQVLTGPGYLSQKRAAALQGTVFNPQLGYLPINSAHRGITTTDWSNLGPRVSMAWNPAFSWGPLHHLFGDHRGVLRGGYSIVYDRVNTIQSVVIPMLGVGFAQTINVRVPNCGASGAPGAGCNTSPATPNPGLSGFRVGVDGTIPLPTVPSQSIPVVPSIPFGETLSFQVDPTMKVGRSHDFDVTFQREMPANMLLEVGWIGHYASHLPEAVNLANNPYMFVDTASHQSFAKAFDAVATELRTGQPVTTQPWFENQLPGFAALPSGLGGCGGHVATSTACLAANNNSAFVNGLVSNLFTSMNIARQFGLGLQPYDNLEALTSFIRTYVGVSNYNGLVVSLEKRATHGLLFDLNYTFSKTLDQNIADQNSAGFYANGYNPQVAYGPSIFDRTHAFTASYVYDVPAGKGHLFHFNNVADKILDGWYLSGIYTAYSGLPLNVAESSQVWGGGSILSNNVSAIRTASISTGTHSGVTGSSNIGTSGDPAKGGSGINLFADPAAAFNAFRPVLIATDGRDGRANPIRGLGQWNYDMAIGKTTSFHERVNLNYSADFFNIFNHVNFQDPSTSLTNPRAFGVITSQFVPTNRLSGARWIEMGLRVEF